MMVNEILCLICLSIFITNSVQFVTNAYLDDGCPAGPVVTSTICGELGNNVWNAASILALAKLLPGNRQPYIRRYHANYLRKYFEEPLIPIVEEIPLTCSCWNGSNLFEENDGKYTYYYSVPRVQAYQIPGNVILHSPAVAVESVMYEMDYIRSRLRYKQELIDYANQVFTNISAEFLNQEDLNNQSLTFVGVHVRRSDYLPLLSEDGRVGPRFFNFAFDYFRNRDDLGKCVFLVSSDDTEWVRENLIANESNSDVFLVGNGLRRHPGKDITVLSMCNHTIYDYGSFGLWGAVYAGGEVVTTTSYLQANQFIIYNNFHFFDPVPGEEILTIDGRTKSF